MTIQEIMQSIDNIAYSAVAVVKVACPYAMTVAKQAGIDAWRYVKNVDNDYIVICIPKKTHPGMYAPLINAIAQFTTDFIII